MLGHFVCEVLLCQSRWVLAMFCYVDHLFGKSQTHHTFTPRQYKSPEIAAPFLNVKVLWRGSEPPWLSVWLCLLFFVVIYHQKVSLLHFSCVYPNEIFHISSKPFQSLKQYRFIFVLVWFWASLLKCLCFINFTSYVALEKSYFSVMNQSDLLCW